MKKIFIRRVGCHTNRVSKGKVYEVGSNGKIIDDLGGPMRPTMNSNKYWTVCEEPQGHEPYETQYITSDTEVDFYIKWLKNTGGLFTYNKIYAVKDDHFTTDTGSPYPFILDDTVNQNNWEIIEAHPQKNESAYLTAGLQYIKRLGSTNTIATKGKIYQYVNGEILSDAGEMFTPDIRSIDAYPIWVFTDEKGNEISKPINPTNISTQEFNPTINPTTETKKESTMLKITKPTLINGNDADDYSINCLIDKIKEEECKIEALNAVKTVSKAIAKIKKQHNENIKELTAILDARED